jgi:hypothetical protein
MKTYRIIRRVALVRTEVSEEYVASIIRVTTIVELGTTLAVTRNRTRLRGNTQENLKFYLRIQKLNSIFKCVFQNQISQSFQYDSFI